MLIPLPLPSDYYCTLEEACQFELPKRPPFNGFNILKNNPELRHQIASKLDSLGFRRFCYLGSGSYAIVFKTTDDQLVRISSNQYDAERLKHPAILQPIASYIIGEARIEVLPKMHSFQLDSDQFCELSKLFDKGNFIQADDYSNNGNLALMKDGTPIVIDGGTIRPTETSDTSFNDKKYNLWMSEKKDEQGNSIWKQNMLYPNIWHRKI